MTAALLLLVAAQSVLTLSQAESNTRTNLPALRVARAQTTAQKAVRDQSYAQYMPQISGQAHDFFQTYGSVGPPRVQPVTAGNDLHAAVSATQLIYDFNQTIDRIKSGDALTE